MGINGGGKSTLFKAFTLAEVVPMSGSVWINGLDVVNNCWDIGPSLGSGYVPQEGGLLDFLTVKETVMFFRMIRLNSLKVTSVVSENERIIHPKYSNNIVRSLSGGTRKKLAVQVSNIGSPSCLFMDECTTGVGNLLTSLNT